MNRIYFYINIILIFCILYYVFKKNIMYMSNTDVKQVSIGKYHRGTNTIEDSVIFPTIDIKPDMSCLESLRMAGSIHKMIRRDMHQILKPGLDLFDLSTFINRKIRYYTNDIGVNGGIGFPPILSMSNIIAHYSPYKKMILGYNDNLKIDFGVHVNGWIVDSAFTIHFNPDFDVLSIATKDAIDNALKVVGIDTPIDDISSTINEIVESYEMMYRGSLHQLKVIDGVSGHNIKQYNIHGGLTIPNKPSYNTQRMAAGVYAIEPFVSIIDSSYYEGNEQNNYRIKPQYIKECNQLYERFNNLIFSDSHLLYYNINIDYYKKNNMIDIYPALYGHKDDLSCQYEHTVYLDESLKEVISRSYDY